MSALKATYIVELSATIIKYKKITEVGIYHNLSPKNHSTIGLFDLSDCKNFKG
jgi:hypothetical protein